jgi:hypothetical protein
MDNIPNNISRGGSLWKVILVLRLPEILLFQAYANSKGVKIIGDMPIYVGGHSADVWSNQKLFELGPTGAPAEVSGVPPDAFSETGGSAASHTAS